MNKSEYESILRNDDRFEIGTDGRPVSGFVSAGYSDSAERESALQEHLASLLDSANRYAEKSNLDAEALYRHQHDLAASEYGIAEIETKKGRTGNQPSSIDNLRLEKLKNQYSTAQDGILDLHRNYEFQGYASHEQYQHFDEKMLGSWEAKDGVVGRYGDADLALFELERGITIRDVDGKQLASYSQNGTLTLDEGFKNQLNFNSDNMKEFQSEYVDQQVKIIVAEERLAADYGTQVRSPEAHAIQKEFLSDKVIDSLETGRALSPDQLKLANESFHRHFDRFFPDRNIQERPQNEALENRAETGHSRALDDRMQQAVSKILQEPESNDQASRLDSKPAIKWYSGLPNDEEMISFRKEHGIETTVRGDQFNLKPMKIDGYVAERVGQRIDYKSATGDVAFRDRGDRVSIPKQVNKAEKQAHHDAAMKLASSKFKNGFRIKGSDESKQCAARAAVHAGCEKKILNPELHEYMKEYKQSLQSQDAHQETQRPAEVQRAQAVATVERALPAAAQRHLDRIDQRSKVTAPMTESQQAAAAQLIEMRKPVQTASTHSQKQKEEQQQNGQTQ